MKQIKCLEALIRPHSLNDFFRESWPAQPLVVHGLGESIQELQNLPFLASLEALLERWPKRVQAHLPDACDESSSIDVSPLDAKKLFANKMPLLFNNADSISPVLSQWLIEISKDLGLPASTHGRCMIYATPDGRGTNPHFDQNVNFIVQMHGTKTWWLAPNTHVENPTERYAIGQPLDPELASYSRLPMPVSMPEASTKFVLQPGSMLFLPRGFWHRTEATGNALALNFTFSQPTWIDLLTAALRSRLSLSSEWRELADGVRSDESTRRIFAKSKFDALLIELVDDLPNWNAGDILSATEGEFES